MNLSFGDALRQARIEKELSQQQLAQRIHVDRSSIANWEAGRRLPDAITIARLSQCVDLDVTSLLYAAKPHDEQPRVIIADDEDLILDGGLPILEQVMPKAAIVGFTKPSDVIDFAKNNKVDIAFLDIEMGRISGLDVCKRLLDINPKTNVIFLTAYSEYAFEAWDTGACGYLIKPLTPDSVRRQLARLRNPVIGLE